MANKPLPVIEGPTYRQLDYWARAGYLNVGAYGSGTMRDWSDEEIRVATVMARLTAAGLTPPAAEKVARGQLELAPGVFVLVDPERGADG